MRSRFMFRGLCVQCSFCRVERPPLGRFTKLRYALSPSRSFLQNISLDLLFALVFCSRLELDNFTGKCLTRFGSGHGQPCGIAVSGDGDRIMVSYPRSHPIQIYRLNDYSLLKTLSPNVSNPADSYRFTDIGVMGSCLYALDPENYHLHVFSEPEYEKVTVWKLGDRDGVGYMTPFRGSIYLAAFYAGPYVKVYSESGSQLSSFTLEKSPEFGYLRLCISEDAEELVVANQYARCVQHYTLDGKFLREWSLCADLFQGRDLDWLQPFVVGENLILACSSLIRPSVLRLTTGGTFLTEFGSPACHQPAAIGYAADLVFIADQDPEGTENESVLVFK